MMPALSMTVAFSVELAPCEAPRADPVEAPTDIDRVRLG